MAMPVWMLEAWNQLSAEKQKQAGDYLQFLLAQQSTEHAPGAAGFPFGLLKGEFDIADNFDDPLPGLEDYM